MSVRRGIVFVLTLLMIGVLAACGNGDAEGASSEGEAESANETIDMGQHSCNELKCGLCKKITS